MDEQNLQETKSASIAQPLEKPVLIPTPQLKNRGFIYFAIAVILIISGCFGYYYLNKKTNNENLIPNSSSLKAGNLPYGFPADLFFEPEAKITKDESSYSADGKTLIINRSYESKRSIELNSKVVGALEKKGWQVVNIDNSDPSKKLSFSAIKGDYKATVSIISSDPKTSLMDISVNLSVKK